MMLIKKPVDCPYCHFPIVEDESHLRLFYGDVICPRCGNKIIYKNNDEYKVMQCAIG